MVIVNDFSVLETYPTIFSVVWSSKTQHRVVPIDPEVIICQTNKNLNPLKFRTGRVVVDPSFSFFSGGFRFF